LGDEVTFLGIGGQADASEMATVVDRTGTGGFTHLVDVDGSLWAQFGADIRSSFLFIGDDGSIQRTGYGEMDEDRLRSIVEDLAADRS
jgi:hypothetical protein